MFVDVRDLDKEAKAITNDVVSIIRLNTLNKCKRLHGNVRKLPGEYVVRSWKRMRDSRFPMGRNSQIKRELGVLVPLVGKRLPARILFDQIERQMIEGRPHLVDHLSHQNTNLSGRRLRDVQPLFALRLRDDSVRLTSGISGDATLNSSEVFCSPDELNFRRFDATGHCDKEY